MCQMGRVPRASFRPGSEVGGLQRQISKPNPKAGFRAGNNGFAKIYKPLGFLSCIGYKGKLFEKYSNYLDIIFPRQYGNSLFGRWVSINIKLWRK